MGREASRSYLLGFSSAIAAEGSAVDVLKWLDCYFMASLRYKAREQCEELGSQNLVHDCWLIAQSSFDEWRLALCYIGFLGAEISESGDISCLMTAWRESMHNDLKATFTV